MFRASLLHTWCIELLCKNWCLCPPFPGILNSLISKLLMKSPRLEHHVVLRRQPDASPEDVLHRVALLGQRVHNRGSKK